MIGRFIEVAVPAREILRSIGFYEELGFCQLNTGDMWPHAYAVLSDGQVQVGLHDTQLPGALLTFVLPDLAAEIAELRSRGLRIEQKRTADDEFNHLVAADLDRHRLRLVEARTFSPPGFDEKKASLCGRFREIALPVQDMDAAAALYHRLGFEEVERLESPYPYLRVAGNGVALGLHQTRDLADPALVFGSPDIDGLERLGISVPLHAELPGYAHLRAPDGLDLLITADRPA